MKGRANKLSDRTMILLDGKETSKEILHDIQVSVTQVSQAVGRSPRLDMILVGEDFASERYVRMKEKKATEVGFEGVVHRIDESEGTAGVIEKVNELNLYPDVDGFMVQLPLPESIDEREVLEAIDPHKDVDGLTSINLGRTFQGEEAFLSATPKGIMMLLEKYEIELKGKNVVIVGRSKIVGLPLAASMMKENATVTIAHSKTEDLAGVCSRADVLVAAAGFPKLITPKHVKEDAVVIDVGTNKDPESNILVGDVDYISVAPRTSYITPVPGGVGPMTIAALMMNTLESYKARTA